MDQSKLAQAREEKGYISQQQLAEAIGVDVSTVSRWETGETLPRGQNRQKLCLFFEKSAQELGLDTGENRIVIPQNAAFRTLARNPVTRLLDLAHMPLCTYQEVHSKMRHISEECMNTTRRDILIGALRSLVSLPLASEVLRKSQYEAMLTQCTTGIAACWELMSSTEADDFSLAFDGVSAYLPILDAIARELPQLQKEALALAARCALLKTILGWHCRFTEATQYAKIARKYSEESGDMTLLLSASSKLAWAYFYDKKYLLALETAMNAQTLLERYSSKNAPLPSGIRGGTYSTLAIMQAKNGRASDSALGKATERDPGNEIHAFMEYTRADIPRETGLVHYYQGDQKAAMAELGKMIDPKTLVEKVPQTERGRIEVINFMALSSLKDKDRSIEKTAHFWIPVITEAKTLRSEWGYTEAMNTYNLMEVVWPDETRVTELRDLTEHW